MSLELGMSLRLKYHRSYVTTNKYVPAKKPMAVGPPRRVAARRHL